MIHERIGAIINLFQEETRAWERETVMVTQKVGFDMREVIETAIKNYYGIFNKPKDEATGRMKTFVPITETTVEAIVKNIDLDLSDIRIRAQRPDRYGSASVMRQIVRWHLRRQQFGEVLNEFLRDVVITGTAIAKIQKGLDPITGKQRVIMTHVHPLNFIIDPTARNVQEAPAVYERNVISIREAQDKPWENTEKIQGSPYVPKVLFSSVSGVLNQPDFLSQRGVPSVEVYERWGLFEKYLLTDRESDKGKYVNGVIIVSDLWTNPQVQVVKMRERIWKPYEEARFKKVPGRFHGRGAGEMLLDIQELANETVNIRVASNRIRHLGLWRLRKGAGITQEQISRLVASSAILTPRETDITPLPVPDMPPSAYKDEQILDQWAERVTGSSRIEEVAARQPATTSVLQSQQSRSSFSLYQENFGFFLERALERHYIPDLVKTLKIGDIINITGDPRDLRSMDEALVSNFINKEIIAFYEDHGEYPSTAEVERAKQDAIKKLRRMGDSRFLEIREDILDPDFSTEVYITPEAIDKNLMIQQLNQALQVTAQVPQLGISPTKILKEVLDLLGLGGERFTEDPDETAARTPVELPNQSARTPTPGEQMAMAATPMPTGRAPVATL